MPSFVSQRWNVEGSTHHFSVQRVDAQPLGSDSVRRGVIWRPPRGECSSRPSLHRSTNTTQHSSFPARRDIHKGQMRWRRVDPHDSHYGVIKNLPTQRECVCCSLRPGAMTGWRKNVCVCVCVTGLRATSQEKLALWRSQQMLLCEEVHQVLQAKHRGIDPFPPL